eukprot:m.1257623 g.1257623  ORF g.1257623 m.1257623 type:complete len:456 (-) comp24715_c0_seq24:3547-4914(-)
MSLVFCHYGVVVVFSAMLLDICTSPGHSTGLNIFMDYLIRDIDMSRTSLSLTWTIALVISSCFTPVAGMAIDRIGVQPIVAMSTVAFAASLVGLSTATTPLMLCVYMSLMRFSGPQCMYVCATTTVNRWFVRKRGIAAVVRSLDECILVGFPEVIASTIATIGWRHTYRLLAAVVCGLGGCAALLLRTDPESQGLLPDGDGTLQSHTTRANSAGSSVEESSQNSKRGMSAITKHQGRGDDASVYDPTWEFADVIRSATFWKICGCTTTFSLFWAGMNLHAMDIFATHGLTSDEIAPLTVAFGFAFTAGSIFTGTIIDKASTAQRLRLITRSYGAVTVCIWLISVPPGGTFAINSFHRAAGWYLAYGIVCGVNLCINSILVADIFGRKVLGSLNGTLMAFTTASSGIGPLLFGACRDYTGGYRPVILALTAAVGFATAFLSTAHIPLPPSRKVNEA